MVLRQKQDEESPSALASTRSTAHASPGRPELVPCVVSRRDSKVHGEASTRLQLHSPSPILTPALHR